MPNYPDIHNLMLKACCIDTINRINNRIKLGNILTVGIGVGAWVNIFGPSPSTLNTIVSVKRTSYEDLERIVRATAAITVIVKEVCKSECQQEQLIHNNNYQLSLFWEGLSNVFMP